MTLTFLGSGTSTGVPQLRCSCPTCTSTDVRDKRLRASVLLQDDGRTLLIDCGPDFRFQALREGIEHIDALLVTHSHYDHVGGIDDLRPYTHPDGLDIYCAPDVASDLRDRMPYCFKEVLYPGVPQISLRELRPFEPLSIAGFEVVPLPVMHYKLPILGFKIGNLAYITDAKTICRETIDAIRGIDTLVINALRIREHISHVNLEQALELVSQIGPRRAYLTHISHDMGKHAVVDPTLPPNVHLAYDCLKIEV